MILSLSHIPQKISGKIFTEGIKEMFGRKKYVTREVSSALKKAGLSSHIIYKNRDSLIKKSDFLKAVKALEEAGIIEHKSGKAAQVYKKAATWESWQKTKGRNIERRQEEYRREARELIDKDERRREKLQIKDYGVAESGPKSASALPSSASRLIRSRDVSNKDDRRAHLDNLRDKMDVKEDPSKSGWSGNKGSGDTFGKGNGWKA